MFCLMCTLMYFFMQWKGIFKCVSWPLNVSQCFMVLKALGRGERSSERAHEEGGVTGKCSTSLQFPWLEGQAAGALAPSFTLQSGGVFPLNTTVLFHRVSRSHLLCSSSLYLSFSSYQRLSVMRASAGQEVMRWIKPKERVGNGHKDSWEELWRIRTLFWCLGVYEETGWIDGRRSEGELTDGAGLIGGSLNEP